MLSEGHVNSYGSNGWFPVQVHATVYLNVNETVGLRLIEGFIFEESDKHTLFGGFLISPIQ